MPGRILLLVICLGLPVAARALPECRYSDWRDALLSDLQVCSEQGHGQAQYRYARLRDDARGADKDRKAAAVWYRRAALQGHALAQYRLGRLYARGDNVERSLVETFAWWKIASVNGHIGARWELKRLSEQLTVEQFAAGRRLIHERESTAIKYQ
tara:strand:+ start:811 stop:1275 length:465 start_codon:yes stop_codon:yes gene_type:complete